jgi:hypothetical protein
LRFITLCSNPEAFIFVRTVSARHRSRGDEAGIVKGYQLAANCYLNKPQQLDSFEDSWNLSMIFGWQGCNYQVNAAVTMSEVKPSTEQFIMLVGYPRDFQERGSVWRNLCSAPVRPPVAQSPEVVQ